MVEFTELCGFSWSFTSLMDVYETSWYFMNLHIIPWKFIKNGAFCAPGPRTYWIPKDFQWFWRHPSPRKCTEITKLCGISRISRIFTEKAEMTEIHDFLSISRFGVAEPSRNLPRRYVYKGVSTPGGEDAHISPKWGNVTKVMAFHGINHI